MLKWISISSENIHLVHLITLCRKVYTHRRTRFLGASHLYWLSSTPPLYLPEVKLTVENLGSFIWQNLYQNYQNEITALKYSWDSLILNVINISWRPFYFKWNIYFPLSNRFYLYYSTGTVICWAVVEIFIM